MLLCLLKTFDITRYRTKLGTMESKCTAASDQPSISVVRPSSECTKGGREGKLSESPKVRKASGIEYVPPPQQHQ